MRNEDSKSQDDIFHIKELRCIIASYVSRDRRNIREKLTLGVKHFKHTYLPKGVCNIVMDQIGSDKGHLYRLN